MTDASMLVIGSINMDLVVQATRMPGPGETVMGQAFVTVPGGKGANQAVAAARLGAAVHMIGAVGADDFGNELRAGLQEEGIHITHVGRVDTASGVALIQVDAAGENAITVVPGANSAVRLPPSLAFDELLASVSVVLMQLEIPLELVATVIDTCQQVGVPVMLDPAPAPAGGLSTAHYAVDVFTPNQHEASVLSGEKVVDVGSATRASC